MTLAYEAARAATAKLIGGQDANEVVFTRGATEAINLVARTLPARRTATASCCRALEHHSNIVPWQLAGYEVDVCPLTARRPDRPRRRRGDADRAARDRRLRPCLERARLDPRRHARRRPRARGRRETAARRLPGRAAPRRSMSPRSTAISTSSPATSSTARPGSARLWARAELLDAMPPWQGGGAMIDRVTFAKTTYAPAPQRFEAGTPHIVGAIGLHAAIDWIESIGLDAIHAHEVALVGQCRDALLGDPRRDPVRARGQRRNRQLRASTGCIRTTSPPYWTTRASRSAPGIIARSR